MDAAGVVFHIGKKTGDCDTLNILDGANGCFSQFFANEPEYYMSPMECIYLFISYETNKKDGYFQEKE
jgi:hypothetical protein